MSANWASDILMKKKGEQREHSWRLLPLLLQALRKTDVHLKILEEKYKCFEFKVGIILDQINMK